MGKESTAMHTIQVVTCRRKLKRNLLFIYLISLAANNIDTSEEFIHIFHKKENDNMEETIKEMEKGIISSHIVT